MSSSDSEQEAEEKKVTPKLTKDGDYVSLRLVISGDLIGEIASLEDTAGKVILGPGLCREAGDVFASRCGVLRTRTVTKTVIFWVDCHAKRYVASKHENVLGVVLGKAGDAFRVDIGTSENATLSYLAFEGATKKNRPNLNVGDVVYAKLIQASKDMEPELVCVDSYGKKAGLGLLEGGFLFTVPLHLGRKLLTNSCVLLKQLGKEIPFEVAVGANGRVWIRAKTVKETICLVNAIIAAEHMDNREITAMVSKLSSALAGF